MKGALKIFFGILCIMGGILAILFSFGGSIGLGVASAIYGGTPSHPLQVINVILFFFGIFLISVGIWLFRTR